MDFQYLSDVNVQFLTSSEVARLSFRAEAPHLLLCGDIGTPSLATYHDFLSLVSPLFRRVFVVSGNQEAFGSTPAVSDALIRKVVARFDNVTFLQNEAYHFPDSDVSIFGATFWTRMPYMMHRFVVERIADYGNIHGFTPADACDMHELSCQALRAALDATPGRRWVVMSHHAPRMRAPDISVRGPHQPARQPKFGPGKWFTPLDFTDLHYPVITRSVGLKGAIGLAAICQRLRKHCADGTAPTGFERSRG